jgi:hypothetical protein
MKVIITKIDHCNKCPHKSHAGGFAPIAYKPRCDLKKRALPYKLATIPNTQKEFAITEQIPSWCPLEDE